MFTLDLYYVTSSDCYSSTEAKPCELTKGVFANGTCYNMTIASADVVTYVKDLIKHRTGASEEFFKLVFTSPLFYRYLSHYFQLFFSYLYRYLLVFCSTTIFTTPLAYFPLTSCNISYTYF